MEKNNGHIKPGVDKQEPPSSKNHWDESWER